MRAYQVIVQVNITYLDGLEDRLTRFAATALTSGPAFVAQVRSLFDMPKDKAPPRTEAGSQTHTNNHLHSDETNHVTLGLMLSLEQSQHLLDRFLFYLGVSQHFSTHVPSPTQ